MWSKIISTYHFIKSMFYCIFHIIFFSFSLPLSDTCTSPLSTRCGVRPSSLAARAVILQWLDWIPPHVITCLHFVCKASASKNSSFLICENNALSVYICRLFSTNNICYKRYFSNLISPWHQKAVTIQLLPNYIVKIDHSLNDIITSSKVNSSIYSV